MSTQNLTILKLRDNFSFAVLTRENIKENAEEFSIGENEPKCKRMLGEVTRELQKI